MGTVNSFAFVYGLCEQLKKRISREKNAGRKPALCQLGIQLYQFKQEQEYVSFGLTLLLQNKARGY